MKNWIFRSDGTVTVFCALIMMFLTLFFMVLIDYARILLFQRTAESALRLSAQSVISAYDRELYSKYGLFARGGSDGERLFRQAMELNLLNSQAIFSTQQGSDFAQSKLDHMELFEGEYLGMHTIFERQVLEEVKYKAPIDFTLELLEQWLPLKEAVTKAESLITIINELEMLFADRERNLEEVLRLQKKLGGLLGSSSFYKVVTTSASSTLSGYPSYLSWLRDSASLAQQIEQVYQQLSQSELSKAEKLLYETKLRELERQRDKYSVQINSYIETASNVTASIHTSRTKLLSESQQLAEQIFDLLQEARALDQTISIKYELYLTSDAGQQAGNASELESELNKLKFDDSIIRGDDYFKRYSDAIQQQQTSMSEMLAEGSKLAEQLQSLVNQPILSAHTSTERLSSTNQLATNLDAAAKQYVHHYDSPASLLTQWEREMKGSRELRTELAQYEGQFQEAVGEFDKLAELFQAKAALQHAQAEYDAVQRSYQENYDRNAYVVSSNEDVPLHLEGSGSRQAMHAISKLASILKAMENGAASIRDHVYLNEYIIGRFSSFPMGDLASQGKISAELFDISEQEVEYILYGVHKPLANVLLAYGEVFAVRMAIRTIEGFIANRGLTQPLLILGAAVVHGVRQAVADMRELLQDGKTELSRYVPGEISYEQYLRLFLLLRIGSKKVKLSRIIALIEHDVGVSLLAVPTSVTVQAELSMKLWALPGVAALAGAMGPVDSEVNGNTYKRTELVTASY